MGTPYVGEIRMFAGNFAPAGWAFCDGSLLSISENETLFNLIGTIYGGDGQTTFAVPDLRGRLPLHQGNGFILAETGGVEQVTLTSSQIPAHTHTVQAVSNPAESKNPTGSTYATLSTELLYRPPAGVTTVNMGSTLTNVGGNQPHSNLMPYLCVSFIISLYGIYPSPT